MLGTLQMGSVTGTLFGPVLGGLLADSFGFQYTFVITSISVIVAALIVLFGIQGTKASEKCRKQFSIPVKPLLSGLLHHRLMLNVMIVTALIQVGNFSIQPLLSLYVSDLTDAKDVAFLAGVTFSAAGVGNLLFARYWGKLGDDIGYEKVLINSTSPILCLHYPASICHGAMAAYYLPTALRDCGRRNDSHHDCTCQT